MTRTGRCTALPRGLASSGGTDYIPRAEYRPMPRTPIHLLRFADRLEKAEFIGLPFRS